MYLKILLKAILLAVIFTIINSLPDIFTGTAPDFSYYGWEFISNFLIFIILGYYINHSDISGTRLVLSVFVIYFVVGYLNLIIEAIIFNLTDIETVLKFVPKGFIMAIIISPIIVFISGKWNRKTGKTKIPSRPLSGWIWRAAAGSILYLIFYITAGLILINVYPQLAKFYITKQPPPPALIFGTQLIRGLFFVGIAALISSTVNLSFPKKAVLIGMIFSIIGGIAPLMLPNPEMPAFIRLAHGFEVGISNFLYGLVLGYLIGRKTGNDKK